MIQEQQDALPPLLWRDKKKRSRKYSPSLRQTRGRCVIREQRRLKRDKYKGESSRRVQVIPALRSKGCADGIRTWKQQPGGGGSERPGEMQTEEEKAEAVEEKRYNFTTLVSPLLCLFPPEVVRTLAAHRSARQPGGARAASAGVQRAPRRLVAHLSHPETMKVKTRVVLRCAVNDAVFFLSLSKFSCCCVYCRLKSSVVSSTEEHGDNINDSFALIQV